MTRWVFAVVAGLSASTATALDLWVFTKADCPPCEKLKSELHNGLSDGFDLYVIDVTLFPDLATKHRVRETPTSIVFDEDGEVRRKIGFGSAEGYRSWLKAK